MLELPFNLSGRRKNANLEVVPFALVLVSSNVGARGDGTRLMTLCRNPIDGKGGCGRD